MRKQRGRRGFTIVELCVVMAVAAIVATMVVTSVILFTRHHDRITQERSSITEITETENTVTSWLRTYDNASHVISVDATGTKLIASSTTGKPVSTLKFNKNGKTINIDDGEATVRFKSISKMYFEQTADGKIIKIITVYGADDDEQILLLPLFTGVARDRIVTGR